MKNMESSPNVRLFKEAVDAKFIDERVRSPYFARQYEEEVVLIPISSADIFGSKNTQPLHVEAVRPKPDKEREAALIWNIFGGHRITSYNSDGQIDFYIAQNDIHQRMITRGSEPGRTIDRLLSPESIDNLIEWINEMKLAKNSLQLLDCERPISEFIEQK